MKKKTLTQVTLEVSVHLRYLYQCKGIRGKELLKMYPKHSKATIYRHAKKPLADKTVEKRKHNHGRPKKSFTTRQVPNSPPNIHTSGAIWLLYYKTIES